MNPDFTGTEPGPLDDTDLAILADVRSIWDAIDPVPPGLIPSITFALTMRALEAELAELIEPELALTRAGVDDLARTESMTFTSSRCTVMVTLDLLPDGTARVDGWITTPLAVVRLHGEQTELTTTADDTGRFVFDRVPRGPARFVIWPDGDLTGRPVLTPTTTI